MARQPARGKAGKKVVQKGYKSVLTKLNVEAWRQLKRLAIDKDKPVSELQCEAIKSAVRHTRPAADRRALYARGLVTGLALESCG
jgi:hypothetical protein